MSENALEETPSRRPATLLEIPFYRLLEFEWLEWFELEWKLLRQSGLRNGLNFRSLKQSRFYRTAKKPLLIVFNANFFRFACLSLSLSLSSDSSIIKSLYFTILLQFSFEDLKFKFFSNSFPANPFSLISLANCWRLETTRSQLNPLDLAT